MLRQEDQTQFNIQTSLMIKEDDLDLIITGQGANINIDHLGLNEKKEILIPRRISRRGRFSPVEPEKMTFANRVFTFRLPTLAGNDSVIDGKALFSQPISTRSILHKQQTQTERHPHQARSPPSNRDDKTAYSDLFQEKHPKKCRELQFANSTKR